MLTRCFDVWTGKKDLGSSTRRSTVGFPHPNQASMACTSTLCPKLPDFMSINWTKAESRFLSFFLPTADWPESVLFRFSDDVTCVSRDHLGLHKSGIRTWQLTGIPYRTAVYLFLKLSLRVGWNRNRGIVWWELHLVPNLGEVIRPTWVSIFLPL